MPDLQHFIIHSFIHSYTYRPLIVLAIGFDWLIGFCPYFIHSTSNVVEFREIFGFERIQLRCILWFKSV
jgi:hypothetical protein